MPLNEPHVVQVRTSKTAPWINEIEFSSATLAKGECREIRHLYPRGCVRAIPASQVTPQLQRLV